MKKRSAQHRNRRPAPRASRAPQSSTPLLVEIEKPIYGGNFLARAEGKAIFVPRVLPGEQARVCIVEDKRSYATSELDSVVTPSPGRVAPRCPHFTACGGCHYQHAGYTTELAWKEAVLREVLHRVHPFGDFEILSADPWSYRNRIRVAFDTAGNPGYRLHRSRAIVGIHECPIAAPLLVRAALAAGTLVGQLVPSARPSEISLFSNADETELIASAYSGGASSLQFETFAQSLAERIPALIGAQYVIEPDGQPPRTAAQWGAPSLHYRAAGFNYRVDHGAFFQVNRWLVDALVDRVVAAHSGRLAWDLFAGVGLFARRLASTFDRVVAVESAPPAVNALEANLTGTSSDAVRSSTLDFLRANAKSERPDLIVVDPPRTGLGNEVTALLTAIAAPALTYVSCDPATLARDLAALIAGGYVIGRVTLVDLFPQTFHLETVVDLRRA